MSFKIKWLYRLQEDFVYQSKHTFAANYAFLDKNGVRRFEIYANGKMKVLDGYAWDGCSPKFKILDLAIGTPDGVTDADTLKPKTYYASLVHDALCQFFLADLPLSKREVDKIFLDLMGKTHFKLRYLYYIFVRIFGYPLLLVDKIKRNNKGTRVEF